MNLSLYIFLTSFLSIFAKPSNSAIQSFVYVGCSPIKYNPGSRYESNVNSILASFVNSASVSTYNNFNISIQNNNDMVYGLFQCRGDLDNPNCHNCIASAVTRLGTLCAGAVGGALQLEGCYIRYDNASFLGVEDKTVVSEKCGPSIGYDSETRDGVLAYLTNGDQYFRFSGTGRVQGVAQCMQDLSMNECRDCLMVAIQRLRDECESSAWGDMFLAKCYARYSERGRTSRTGNNDEDVQKTLAIFIGLIAGVALLIVFLSFLSKSLCGKGGK